MYCKMKNSRTGKTDFGFVVGRISRVLEVAQVTNNTLRTPAVRSAYLLKNQNGRQPRCDALQSDCCLPEAST
jgi:hypothetical protein